SPELRLLWRFNSSCRHLIPDVKLLAIPPCSQARERALPLCYNRNDRKRFRCRKYCLFLIGEWLSLVEHLVRDQGVGGSNPLSPTNNFQRLAILDSCRTSKVKTPSETELFQMNSWLEVAIVAALFAIGNIVLGHFEAGTPKWRRVLKVILVLTATRLITTQLGRPWSFLFIGSLVAVALIVHLWWLPRH